MVTLAGVGRAQEPDSMLVTLRGTVTDSSFRPVAGVLVYLAVARIFSSTDDEGRFELAEVTTGEDTLEFRGQRFAPRSFRLILPDSVQGSTIDLGTVDLRPGPLPTLALSVTVSDTLQDQSVGGAEVMVNERVVGETDTTGTLSATEIPIEWGINTVLVRRVGYSPLFRTFWVGEQNARRSLVGFMDQQAVDLPAVVVEGDRIIFAYGRMREFWRRRERGWGRFFTRADIEQRHPIYVSDMLFAVPGFSVYRLGGRTVIRSSRSAGRCGPSIWLDGMQVVDGDVDALVRPQDVEAIEVYRGGAETPVEFSRAFNDCGGAVVIWTR